MHGYVIRELQNNSVINIIINFFISTVIVEAIYTACCKAPEIAQHQLVSDSYELGEQG